MKIERNYNLSKLNTFGFSVKAKFFVEIKSETDLLKLFNLPEFKNNEKIFLGGGSNVLFTKDFDGIVVLNRLKGIEIIRAEVGEDGVFVRAMGGELWHDLVTFAVNQGYWGIENLALIPGTVGAAPVQNIGAYGVELKNALESVEAFNIETGKNKIFSQAECELGYRDSIFKNKMKGKYFISAVILKLSKIPKPNISYKTLVDYLEKLARRGGNKIIDSKASPVAGLRPRDISDAISEIRRSKLPDPKITGNVGSFFKNVIVPLPRLQELLQAYPDLPYFEENGMAKIPAGWLIEKCGYKGHKTGNVGVHEKQALVLINYGGATGGEIIELANKIITSIKEKFDLELIPEVNIV